MSQVKYSDFNENHKYIASVRDIEFCRNKLNKVKKELEKYEKAHNFGKSMNRHSAISMIAGMHSSKVSAVQFYTYVMQLHELFPEKCKQNKKISVIISEKIEKEDKKHAEYMDYINKITKKR